MCLLNRIRANVLGVNCLVKECHQCDGMVGKMRVKVNIFVWRRVWGQVLENNRDNKQNTTKLRLALFI